MSHLLDFMLLAFSIVILIGIFSSKLSTRFGVPALLLFLVIGMLAGSDGPGGIHFNDAHVARTMGIIALIFILFSGGLDTEWRGVRKALIPGTLLATVGVVLTAALVGVFASSFLGFSTLQGLLLGAIVSSTDAAAVFSVLQSRSVGLSKRLRPLLEFESGSNDPMAVFLTVALIRLFEVPDMPAAELVFWFVRQMSIGAFLGIAMGNLFVRVVNKSRLEVEGLYPVLTFSLVLFLYGLASMLGGSGFLAVYLCGLTMGRREFLYKKSIARFHDGVAWLMQIMMFVTLGLLVFPSRLPAIAAPSLLLALFLMFVARPAAVFASLLPVRMRFQEKLLVAWVGLRGAAPIVLATFALLGSVPDADRIFNVVFFVVLTSVLIQGTSVPFVAKALGVDAPPAGKKRYPIEFEQTEGVDMELSEFLVPFNAAAAGKAIYELEFPEDCLITLVCRNERFIVASGKTVLEEGDAVLALVNERNAKQVQAILSRQR